MAKFLESQIRGKQAAILLIVLLMFIYYCGMAAAFYYFEYHNNTPATAGASAFTPQRVTEGNESRP
ncbi:hypothetical protein IscW_ISCW014342 [Ixodes scapularis]|uniref:Uncharacterized protein n=1 Tax=Ixodes scapularis TaxID=6945 RepID=B7QM95_IXOSC|nr:hypothetical protein IscW_ISCW014342 [Ixodes scapularis]|eukprot:XP_002416300.1 hypothetical protein IscW_ISCW014342 [Ixodes scapularis]